MGICASTEQCPDFCRKAIKAAGSGVLFVAVCAAGFSLVLTVSLVIYFASISLGNILWFYIFQYFMGLFQGWFFMDILTMGIEFRGEWKGAHPEPRPDDYEAPPFDEEEYEKQTKKEKIVCIVSNTLLCGCYSMCCRQCIRPLMVSEPDEDPYDDGQDDFGVRFDEYVALKTGEDVGDRPLPRDYQTDYGELADEMKRKAKEKQEKAKAATKKALASTKKFGNATKKFGSKYGNKLKAKMNKGGDMVPTDDEGDSEYPDSASDPNEEAVELVVNGDDNDNVTSVPGDNIAGQMETVVDDKEKNENDKEEKPVDELPAYDEVPKDDYVGDINDKEPEVEDKDKKEVVAVSIEP